MCNILTIFQRCTLAIFEGLMKECMEDFMDDFLGFEDSFDEFLLSLIKYLDDVLRPIWC